VLGADHPDVMMNVMHLADLLQHRGDLVPAESLYREAIARGTRINPAGHRLTAEALFGLAAVQLRRGDTTRAEATLQATVAMNERMFTSAERYMYGAVRIQLAEVQMARRDYASAEHALLDVYQVSRRQWGMGNRRTQRDVRELVRLYEAWGKPERALEFRRYVQSPDSVFAGDRAPGADRDTLRPF
jgi:eukaryotic-like serine/threonine-protein kinase